MTTVKIQTLHYERMAYVYVRQSTPWQVMENRESTERQYHLGERAVQLGWPASHVEVINEDQGRSGSTAAHRTGFQRLVTEVGHLNDKGYRTAFGRPYTHQHVGYICRRDGLAADRERRQNPERNTTTRGYIC